MRATVALFVLAGLATGLVLPAGSARAGDAATEEARHHFQRGQQFFDVGRWDDAAEEFEKAYAIRSDPTFLYNMAQAYRRKGDAKRARDLYKNYLIKAPKSPQRAEVEERIRTLQKQIEEADYAVKPAAQNSATLGPAIVAAPLAPSSSPEAAAAPATVAPPPSLFSRPTQAQTGYPATAPVQTGYPSATPAQAQAGTPATAPMQAGYPSAAPTQAQPGYPPAAYQPQPSYVQAPVAPPSADSSGRGLRVSGVICGIVGLVSIGAGVALGLEAQAYSHSVETGSVFNPGFDDRGKLFEKLQWVGYGVGGALVATGALLYGIGVYSARTSVALSPTLMPGGPGIAAQGVF
jgi:hypothetical protein